MGFFNDLGSLLGDAANLKAELETVIDDVQTPINETVEAISSLSDDVSTTVQDTMNDATDSLSGQK